jgi:hypothetical protein
MESETSNSKGDNKSVRGDLSDTVPLPAGIAVSALIGRIDP